MYLFTLKQFHTNYEHVSVSNFWPSPKVCPVHSRKVKRVAYFSSKFLCSSWSNIFTKQCQSSAVLSADIVLAPWKSQFWYVKYFLTTPSKSTFKIIFSCHVTPSISLFTNAAIKFMTILIYRTVCKPFVKELAEDIQLLMKNDLNWIFFIPYSAQ
jgi:hypothetical protein